MASLLQSERKDKLICGRASCNCKRSLRVVRSSSRNYVCLTFKKKISKGLFAAADYFETSLHAAILCQNT